ncbi:FTR1 family iron permease [Photobacterium andalusiense]|uniref:Ferrous iron permease EfeU n=1 Tax=Photobacterium andalusiense TaxID=2204296 RepID=A0A1Y6MGH6_9GAMM|nr:FTR1 family protein [Photobacterium andalusiense]SMY34311.1 Ferrous iron permease EfeU [Photobacterium andalusiense]
MNYGAAIIVFRELLEASLIVSIVLGVTQGIPKRVPLILMGIFLGIIGSVLVALSINSLTNLFDGIGQDLFNFCVLLMAVLMLSWHLVWMSTHGKEIANKIKDKNSQILLNSGSIYSLVFVVSLAVLREGSEIVLFLSGILASTHDVNSVILGAVFGFGAGLIISIILYFGIINIPTKYFFTSTTWLITLVTAGLASSAWGILEQIDLAPYLVSSVWNTGNILSEKSILGQILQTLIGYKASPSGSELIVYISTIAIITYVRITLGKRFLAKSS